MATYKTWITVTDGKIDTIMTTPADKDANKEIPEVSWQEVPNDFNGSYGDKIVWLDKTMHRISDSELITKGLRTDNRGRWYHKNNTGESKLVYNLDENNPGEEWTREEPLKDEPYQMWNEKKKQWVVDTDKKEEAEKEILISEKKAGIAEAEQKRLRSVLAEIDGIATDEDKTYNLLYKATIENLRREIKELVSA